MSHFAPLLLVVVTAALVVLPVIPALHEFGKRQDAGPLSTSRHDGKITNFAESLQCRLAPLQQQLEVCQAEAENLRTRVEGIEVLLVSRNGFNFDPEEMRKISAVLCGHPTCIPSGQIVESDVCSLGDLLVGERAVLRAGVASGDIVLGNDSAVLRWLHAGRTAHLQCGSTAHNRLSAGQSVVLARDSSFQHVHAPVIMALEMEREDSRSVTSENISKIVTELLSKTVAPATVSHLSDESLSLATRPRMRIQGDFRVPAGESLYANVITTGEFCVERGASFHGSAKSYKNTVIKEGASVHGSIACGGMAHIGPDSFLSGPLMVERDVHLSSGSCVGIPNSLTTITACSAYLSIGCRIHGTIWARVQGRVEA